MSTSIKTTRRTPARESVIERDLCDQAKKRGILALKFTSHTNGVPDRVLIGQHAHTGENITAFIEVKRPGHTLRPLQRATISTMIAHGAIVAMTNTCESNTRVLDEIFGIQDPTTVSP